MAEGKFRERRRRVCSDVVEISRDRSRSSTGDAFTGIAQLMGSHGGYEQLGSAADGSAYLLPLSSWL
jgi:hypothetical protein